MGNSLQKPGFLALCVVFASCLKVQAAIPYLTLPPDGSRIFNNTPSLAWSQIEADEFQVWIDGRQIATLPRTATRLVPFPLSFGFHRWKVVAINGSNPSASTESTFTIQDAPMAAMPNNAFLLREHWQVESADQAGTNGELLSGPNVVTDGWANTSVPATVLTALVRNGVYPNPYVSLNNMLIPDASDDFNAKFDLLKHSHLTGKNPWKQPYWYRTSFAFPNNYVGKRIWLSFNEINYRAEVWLNGKQIAEPATMVGMEREFTFDVTSAINQTTNYLAVAIYPVDHPGEPAPPPVTPLADPGRNMGADTGISANYCKWDTIGWDWQPEVHDRDMGITEDVFLSATDDLAVNNLYVCPELDPADLRHASLQLSFDVTNFSQVPIQGRMKIVVKDPAGRSFTLGEPYDSGPEPSRHFVFTAADHPQLRIDRPQLWWPAGLGSQPLYTLQVQVTTSHGQLATKETHFGIRKLETGMDPVTHTRFFCINGRKVFINGGNWVIDMMLNWTASRYADELALARQANLNYLRVWGPTGVPPEAFFDAADRAGILIQQDFLNDNWGTEHNAPGNCPPDDVVEQATGDIIKKCRNHPAVILWCGGNEGPNPHENLIKNQLLPKLDPWGARFYLPASNSDGLQGGGPYDNLPPEKYFNNPKLNGFNSEVGPSGMPEWESLQQFLTLPPTNWAAGRFPLDGQWAYHDAADRPEPGEARKFSHLDTILRTRFGVPKGTDLAGARGYAERAQLLNFDTYRAVTEAINKGLWTKSSGFAFWKYNSSWPSLIWQLDDWYLQCHAGFYATKRGCEPIHVQFNSDDRTLAVVNRTFNPGNDYSIKAVLYDLTLKVLWQHTDVVQANPNTVAPTSWSVPPTSGTTFLKLKLTDRHGSLVSDNLYWLNETNNFKLLADLPGAHLKAKISLPETPRGVVRVTLTNQGKGPALLVRLQLMDRVSHVEILPTFWSDNYVNLLPGESIKLTARTSKAGTWPRNPAISVAGYNVTEAIY